MRLTSILTVSQSYTELLSVQFSHSVVSHSLRPHESQHARPPCPSICQQIWKTQQWPQDWKRSVFIPIPKKGNAKECSNYCTIALISHTSKAMHKFSKPGFSSMWTVNFQMFKLVLEKAKEPEIKLPTYAGSLKKQESSRKTSTSALLTMPKPLEVWITTNCGKFWKRWEY